MDHEKGHPVVLATLVAIRAATLRCPETVAPISFGAPAKVGKAKGKAGGSVTSADSPAVVAARVAIRAANVRSISDTGTEINERKEEVVAVTSYLQSDFVDGLKKRSETWSTDNFKKIRLELPLPKDMLIPGQPATATVVLYLYRKAVHSSGGEKKHAFYRGDVTLRGSKDPAAVL
jgi:hypothetical protein